MTRFGRPRAMHGGWRFAHLLLLVVLAWQGVVLQTHAHFAPAPGAPVGQVASMPVVAAAGTVAHVESASTVPASPVCFLCEEQALFGAYVLAAPTALIAPVAVTVWYDATAGPYSALPQSSHSWRSRAPPALHNLTF